jgi:predicted RNA binding protein YcfA (HicA-like mRNA interferase family)
MARAGELPERAGLPDLRYTVGFVSVRVGELITLLERDGWELRRNAGAHRHYAHPRKPGLVTLAGEPDARLSRKAEASTLKQAGLRKERL